MISWLEEVVQAIKYLGGTANIKEIYQYIENTTERKLPPTWKSSVRKNIEHYSYDSKAYLGKENLFESVNGIGKGLWRLIEDNSTPKATDLSSDDPIYSNPSRAFIEIYRIQRDTKIIKELKTLYDNKCQVCRLSIKLKGISYSEGHHLKPLGMPHSGPDVKANVVILCPNHHVEFDYGMIAINPKTKKLMHKDVLNKINGRSLYAKHHLIEEYFIYHFDNIFKAI